MPKLGSITILACSIQHLKWAHALNVHIFLIHYFILDFIFSPPIYFLLFSSKDCWHWTELARLKVLLASSAPSGDKFKTLAWKLNSVFFFQSLLKEDEEDGKAPLLNCFAILCVLCGSSKHICISGWKCSICTNNLQSQRQSQFSDLGKSLVLFGLLGMPYHFVCMISKHGNSSGFNMLCRVSRPQNWCTLQSQHMHVNACT